MIRHSSSIFLSLIIHIFIAALALFAYKNIIQVKEEIVEKRVCIELCSVVEQKPIVAPKLEPLPKPIIEPEPIIKKKEPLPKRVVKKEIVKEIPVVMPKIEPIIEEIATQEEIVEEIIKENIEQTNTDIIEKTIKEVEKQEVIESKEVRFEREYLQEHLAKIAKLLRDNLYYPRRARTMQEEGEVVVRFVLSKDARAHSIEVVSSRSEILSRSAIKTIEDLSGKFPKPKEDLTLHVPIDYSLK